MTNDIPAQPANRQRPATGRRRTTATAALLAMAAWLTTATGCGSAPAVRLYSLQSPEPAAPAAEHLRPVWISLAPVGVPAQVDQPEWLVRTPDDSLRLLEQTRWAAPLRSEMRAALLDTLQSRWSASDAQQGAPTGMPVWRIVVDVQRFESLPGVEARLEARWSVTPSMADAGAGQKAPTATCHGQWREAATGDVAALAPAHRANLRKLADAVGGALQAAAGGTSAMCNDPAGAAVF